MPILRHVALSSALVLVALPLKGHADETQVATPRPNILWLVSEDNSTYWVSCYGSPNAKTPNIDQLAAEGFRYTHCYDNSAVCAPTRNT